MEKVDVLRATAAAFAATANDAEDEKQRIAKLEEIVKEMDEKTFKEVFENKKVTFVEWVEVVKKGVQTIKTFAELMKRLRGKS